MMCDTAQGLGKVQRWCRRTVRALGCVCGTAAQGGFSELAALDVALERRASGVSFSSRNGLIWYRAR